MERFTVLTGIAAPLDMINVDTDKIIPKLNLRTTQRTGLGRALFEELRFDAAGQPNPEFILNRAPYQHARILVAGDNFGCGSSREHAPWALVDFGIRCIISTSFADIFYNNCFKNGLLPIRVTKPELDALMADARDDENPTLTIDLEQCCIRRPNGATIAFELESFRRKRLLAGLDDVGLTLQKESAIARFEQRQQQQQPWLNVP